MTDTDSAESESPGPGPLPPVAAASLIDCLQDRPPPKPPPLAGAGVLWGEVPRPVQRCRENRGAPRNMKP